MTQNSLLGPDLFGAIVLVIILGGCFAMWYAATSDRFIKK